MLRKENHTKSTFYTFSVFILYNLVGKIGLDLTQFQVTLVNIAVHTGVIAELPVKLILPFKELYYRMN